MESRRITLYNPTLGPKILLVALFRYPCIKASTQSILSNPMTGIQKAYSRGGLVGVMQKLPCGMEIENTNDLCQSPQLLRMTSWISLTWDIPDAEPHQPA